MPDKTGKFFKPKAHILTLLGEELIKSPVMAIYELIKNSYDADAKEVTVFFENIEDESIAKIVVSDNGTGITEDILQNVWLEPGTDFRKPINQEGFREIKKSAIYGRVPMGEKGVGRFAVHKLGQKIRLITRPIKIILDESNKYVGVELLDYELSLEIDWEKFSQSKYLEDVPITWVKRTDEDEFHFRHSHGTFIEISGLKETWTRGMARQLKRQTISMLSPKNDENKFKIDLQFNNQWLVNFPDTNQILLEAPYKLTALLDADYNFAFEYEFYTHNNTDIGYRIIKDDKGYNKNVKAELRQRYNSLLNRKEYKTAVIDEKMRVFDSMHQPFGSILIELYSYDLDSTSLKDCSDTPDLIKKILKEHAGIKVFKGDLRVYDYGDPGNDWLGLDLKRVQNKEWFSNNQNIGHIFLDPENSQRLIEKTNREGFIENESFEQFLISIDYILTQFRAERSKDREKWLKYNKKGSGDSLEEQLNTFKDIINDVDLTDEQKKQQLLLEAENIEKKYEEDKNALLIPAGVGMTASVALHEIEKLVPRMEETANVSPINSIVLKEQVEELKEYVGGILTVLKKGGIKPVNVEDAIEQALSNYGLKLRQRKITIEQHYDETVNTIMCDKRYLITMLMNIIDNSIYWLDNVYRDSKGIYIKAYKTETSINIIIVDNGPGFKDTIEDIVRPFFTRKEDGIGIGMYLIDTIMIKYGKLQIITSEEDLLERNIPSKYDGAAVELVFNKNQ